MSIETGRPIRKKSSRRLYYFCKRFFDIVLSVFAAIVLMPVLLLIALLVKLEDGGPVFYKHKRLGRYRKEIAIYKFRSMCVDADHLEAKLTDAQYEQYMKEFKLDDDPRITRVGSFLRKTSLDELPQLWNIIKGDLSIVGPRPIVAKEIYVYPEEDHERFFSAKPGLTGYWQAYARNDATYESGQRQKMELHYVDHAGFLMDLKIIGKTFVTVLKRTGAK